MMAGSPAPSPSLGKPPGAPSHVASSSISALGGNGGRPGLARASESYSGGVANGASKRNRARSEDPPDPSSSSSGASTSHNANSLSPNPSRSPSARPASAKPSHTPKSPYEQYPAPPPPASSSSSSSVMVPAAGRRWPVEWLAAVADAEAKRDAGESTGPLVPPLGFAMVAPGLYRSGHPNHRNFKFLEGLSLRSVMYLDREKLRPHTDHWAQERGLKVFHYRVESGKDPSAPVTDPSVYASALADILDRRNLPMLVHCNKGKHRVGTLCALLRRVQGYTLEAVGAEWIKFIEEGAPPGSTGLWSPPVHETRSAELRSAVVEHLGKERKKAEGEVKRGKDGRIKDKAHESRSRAREWGYIEDFPIDIVTIRAPDFRPRWLPMESVETFDGK